MTKLPSGFAKDAESIAESIRAEMRIENIDRLDPLMLAAHLEIPVVSLSQLRARMDEIDGLSEAVDILQQEPHAALSAVTVFRDTSRLIIYNDRHSPSRQASDITHEIAHGLLLHPPAAALGLGGCRTWDAVIEAEASYLGGVLLIPGKAARWSAMRAMSVEQTALRFGCSPEMVNWRWNQAGARRLLRRDGGSELRHRDMSR